MHWIRGLYFLLFVVACALTAYVTYLGVLIRETDGQPLRELLQPLAVALVGLLGVGGVVLQLQSAAMRERAQHEKAQENVTAAVRAEMKSIMTIISKASIPEQFAVRFVYPEGKFLWADAARKEDYLTVYKALSGQFGLIKASDKCDAAATIGNVVDFYNYFKAARDATAPLQETPDNDTVQQASKAVVLLLERMYAAAEAIDVSDVDFARSRRVMDAFVKLVDANPNSRNSELAQLWASDAAFSAIPKPFFPDGKGTPSR